MKHFPNAPRIGVDFHVFDGKFQGSRSHILGLFSELITLCPDFQFFFFLDRIEDLRKVQGYDRENVHLVRMPPQNSLTRLLWQLPLLRRRYRLDILHTQYVIPLIPAKGNAVTIHDILFESHPEYFTNLFVRRSRVMMRWAARKADLLFTVSDHSRQEIAIRYEIATDKIKVLHNAWDRSRFFRGDLAQSVVCLRGLTPGEYFLTVGRIEPRKNHSTLLRAYARLKGNPPPLVILGQRDFGYEDFEGELSQLPPTHCVYVFSDVSDDDLPAFYRHAMAFVYPSLAEGFGMPPLEALASGTPVITSNLTAIPEVVGEAGLLIDPHDDVAIENALQKIWLDADLRRVMSERGLAQAEKFSWLESAKILRDSYMSYVKRS